MLDHAGEILYVGKAKLLKRRVSSYFQKNLPSPRIAMMVSRIRGIDVTVTRSEAEALLLENNLIKRHRPPFNILFRDDKSYPYIQIGRSQWPQLGFFRGIPGKQADYFGPYPGSSAVRASIALLQKMFRLRTCDDSVFEHRNRACLLFQIKRCSGPCVGHIDDPSYQEDVRMARLFLQGKSQAVIENLQSKMEVAAASLAFERAAMFRDQLLALQTVRDRQFVSGMDSVDTDIVVAVTEAGSVCVNIAMVRGGEHLGDKPMFPQNADPESLSEVLREFIRQHYLVHPAPPRIILQHRLDISDDGEDDVTHIGGASINLVEMRGEVQRAWVAMAEKNARLASQSRQIENSDAQLRLELLQHLLGIDETLTRIECFDISHTGGEVPVASCVVCIDGVMTSREYRRFNIRDIQAGDDYAAIGQAVKRRYDKLSEGDHSHFVPDLLVIDGGAGQVGRAFDVLCDLGLDQQIPVIGIAKGEGRKEGLEKIIFPKGREPLQLALDDPAGRLLLEIRNEAHRFALVGHRQRRAKPRQGSRLDDIFNVGPQRRRALLNHFGSLADVRHATVEQLAAVPGISQALAEAIYRALR